MPEGLISKFRVERVDPDAQRRHQGCFHFVLDVDHDPHALPAMLAYADSIREDNSQLAREIRQKVRDKKKGPAPREELATHEFWLPDGYFSPLCMKMVTAPDGSGDECGRPPEEHPTMMCVGCQGQAIGEVIADPYDVISGSPLLRPVRYCLMCYNVRVIAAIRWAGGH